MIGAADYLLAMNLSTVKEFGRRWIKNIKYDALPQHGSSRERSSSRTATVREILYGVVRRRSFHFIAATTCAIVILLSIANQDRLTLDSIRTLTSSMTTPESRYLHLLIPSNHKHPYLAKNMLSAALSGLPVPTIINWQKEFNTSKIAAGGSHLGKIIGALDWMNQQGRERDNDLVLMVDGYDVWFQLPTSVLINRYLEVNKRARKRLQAEIGTKAMKAHGIDQHIIISAQKTCWPAALRGSAACAVVPESTLPSDVYGPHTDHVVKQKPQMGKFRARYLNSGIMIGDLKHMRALFERVVQKMAEDPKSGSDQKAFEIVWGEQEYQRAIAREEHLSMWLRLERWFGIFRRSILDKKFRYKRPVLQEDVNYEFGVGLDYEAVLAHAMHNGERDGTWIQFDKEGMIDDARRVLRPSVDRDICLPTDIVNLATSPFPTSNAGSTFPTDATWTSVPLFTDFYTSAVPSMIHMNGKTKKYMVHDLWDRLWFQPYARSLLDRYVRTEPGVEPLATTYSDWGRKIEWWGAERDRGLVRTFGDKGEGKEKFGLFLEGYENEVFRDGRGVWRDPR